MVRTTGLVSYQLSPGVLVSVVLSSHDYLFEATSMKEGQPVPVLSHTRGVWNKLYNATVFSNNLLVVSIGRYATVSH